VSKLDTVLQNIDDGLDAALDRLFALLRIRSISTDPAYAADCRACADWHVADLRSIGFDASARPTPGHPSFTAITTCSPSIRWNCGNTIPSRPRSKPHLTARA
jgi:acetylornithine deacetylase/succinyl-diaminopimelate desuccinylase-like protein